MSYCGMPWDWERITNRPIHNMIRLFVVKLRMIFQGRQIYFK